MKARAFNQITINEKNGTITKTSSKVLKLQDEINYYLHLPDKIASLFPKLIDYKKDYSAYTVEYIRCKNLAELIFTGKINIQEAKTVLGDLFFILDDFHYFKPVTASPQIDIRSFYINKTLERLSQLKNNPYFFKLMQIPDIYINHKKYKNFPVLEKEFIHLINKLTLKNAAVTAIHGDFCFSNILYCPEKKVIRLIDPRGSFGQTGIYGHSYYDYAKLLHCLNGKYDYILNNSFQLQETDAHQFMFNIFSFPMISQLHQYYRDLLLQREVMLKFLYLIECSLFFKYGSITL